LEDVHLAQAINYLEVCNLEVGLLVNFGAKSLQYRRVIIGKKKSASSTQSISFASSGEGLRKWLGAEDSNLYRLIQSQ
jgi:hypothetical protein